MAIIISGPSNDILVNGSSVVTEAEAASPVLDSSYHIYNGQLSLSNTVTTTGFSTTLYTGNGTTQSITTGVDMGTQWGNDASEKFGGLVWVKDRVNTPSGGNYHSLNDTIRGIKNAVYTNATNAQTVETNGLQTFDNTGFSVGSSYSYTGGSYASWNFQTTHRVSGTTNHGKAFTCHYNPFTGFTIVKYEGSGLAGHEIPHYLGRELSLCHIKDLSVSSQWITTSSFSGSGYLNLTNALNGAIPNSSDSLKKVVSTYGARDYSDNYSGDIYIMYGWANSYFDEKSTLIGNYEIGVYQGTGVAGNKVTTRGKPAWIMIKRLDAAENWYITDNQRPVLNTLSPNIANTEIIQTAWTTLDSDGFTLNYTAAGGNNTSGGQYLYMVVYDNDSGSGKSKYPRATDTSTLNLNAHVPFANGIDATGNKVSIAYKNETITLSNALTQGKNYIALLSDGSYVAKNIKPAYGSINPASGDFFSLDTQKWYSNLNVEITPRNYLDCIVYADQNGQPEYVEQIEKVQYFDAVKANYFRGKNACTAWVNFDGATTPPTIRDSYNVSAVIRTATGYYDIYFKEEMDSLNYCIIVSSAVSSGGRDASGILSKYINKVSIQCIGGDGVAYNSSNANIQIFGGKN